MRRLIEPAPFQRVRARAAIGFPAQLAKRLKNMICADRDRSRAACAQHAVTLSIERSR